MEMTKVALRDLCVQHKLYRTPSLNDKLYLNFKGFTHIANLDEYIHLKALFLEGNALQSLHGMPRLEHLKCLYVHQNCLRSLNGIEQLPNLDTVNISSNGLDSLCELQACQNLSTLIAEHNRLNTLEALAPLRCCTNLHTLDLQNNNIEDPAAVNELSRLPELRCLYLKGNPVVSKVQNYRKTVISKFPQLTYLDDRPVTEEERLCCAAWATGGLEAERAERTRIKEEAAARDRRNFEWMQNLRKQGFRKRRAMLGLPDCDTDPYMDTLTIEELQQPEDNSHDEGGFPQEPPELVAARQQLAAFSAHPREEEPADLSKARQQLMLERKPIQEGSWPESDRATAACSSLTTGSNSDGAIYLESVKAAQQELNAAAAVPALVHAGAHSESTAGSSDVLAAAGAGMQTAPLGPDFTRLRAATQAALASVGLSDAAEGVPYSSINTEKYVGLAVQQERDAAPADSVSGRPEQLCKVGSWASSSSSKTPDACTLGEVPPEEQHDAQAAGSATAVVAISARSSESAHDSSPRGENSGTTVALEDVWIAAESHMRAAESDGQCSVPQLDGLYDLD